MPSSRSTSAQIFGGPDLILKYGKGEIEFDPAGEYEVLLPAEEPGLNDQAIEQALASATGHQLSDLSGSSAAVMVSDVTRPAPTHRMLPPLVRALKKMGVNDVKIFFALGTHRRMTVIEEEAVLGRCISLPHAQHDMSRCLHLGETARGTPVEVLDQVCQRDLIIGTGNIEYHYYAGYSGGAKAILPGISSERSININHMMMREPDARSGMMDSPVRQDMEDAASVAGLDFILNVVLNSKKDIVKAVAGDYIQAHREGAAVVDRMYRKVVKPAEIVVTCAGGAPKDINLYQAQKAMDNARQAVLPGGTLILVAECSEGLGNKVFQRWVCDATCPQDCIDRFGREYEFGGHKAAFIAEQSLDQELVLVSSLSPQEATSCFFKHARTLERAVAEARMRHGKAARMLVMPYGGLTLATTS